MADLRILLKEMRIETVEHLWDYIKDVDNLDKKTSELIVERLEDFFNQKIYDIERKS